MKKINILRIVIIFLLIADMVTIFYLSNQKAEISSETSGSIIEMILKNVYKDFDSWDTQAKEEKIGSYQHIVRKLAHMTEYASLGVLSSAFALTYGFKLKYLLFSLLYCSAYSLTDEFHQTFIEERSGELKDVMIDSSGALIGIVLFSLLVFVIMKIKKTKTKKEKIANGYGN